MTRLSTHSRRATSRPARPATSEVTLGESAIPTSPARRRPTCARRDRTTRRRSTMATIPSSCISPEEDGHRLPSAADDVRQLLMRQADADLQTPLGLHVRRTSRHEFEQQVPESLAVRSEQQRLEPLLDAPAAKPHQLGDAEGDVRVPCHQLVHDVGRDEHDGATSPSPRQTPPAARTAEDCQLTEQLARVDQRQTMPASPPASRGKASRGRSSSSNTASPRSAGRYIEIRPGRQRSRPRTTCLDRLDLVLGEAREEIAPLEIPVLLAHAEGSAGGPRSPEAVPCEA